jgi:hypothetical protein
MVKRFQSIDLNKNFCNYSNMLTKDDLKEIEKIMDNKFDEKLGFLPSKEEFFDSMDKIMGELRTAREERLIGSHRISDHEDRIIVLEQKVGISVS